MMVNQIAMASAWSSLGISIPIFFDIHSLTRSLLAFPLPVATFFIIEGDSISNCTHFSLQAIIIPDRDIQSLKHIFGLTLARLIGSSVATRIGSLFQMCSRVYFLIFSIQSEISSASGSTWHPLESKLPF